MSEDVPIFGRESLTTDAERAEWDYWAEWQYGLEHIDDTDICEDCGERHAGPCP